MTILRRSSICAVCGHRYDFHQPWCLSPVGVDPDRLRFCRCRRFIVRGQRPQVEREAA